MAQAGMHGLVGMAVKKWTPAREWLMLGVVLGNLAPDLDNLLVAIATVAKQPTEGLHRTFSHSIITVIALIAVFYGLARVTGNVKWHNLGVGLGVGIVMHSLLDLIIWFNGVELLWPVPLWVNFWENVSPPLWWSQLMMPVEFLFFAGYLAMLSVLARKWQTDSNFLGALRIWTIVQGVLFVVFTVLVYTMETDFMTPYGAVYLLSLGLVVWITIRMRTTVEHVL